MRFRIHVEDLEIEIGGSDERSPAALAFAAAVAPFVVDWLSKRFNVKEWKREDAPPAAATEDDSPPEESSAAPSAPPNGTASPAAAEV